MVAASLLFSLLLALATVIAAKPVLEENSPMRLPLMKRRSLSKYDVVEFDRHRLNSLRKRVGGSDLNSTTSSTTSKTSNSGNVSASYQIASFYTIISVGGKNYSLVVDTGSSNTWIGARKNNRYVKTSTGQFTNNTIHVNYGTGDSNNTDSQNTTAFDGVEVYEKVTIGNVVVKNQSIGVIPAVSSKADPPIFLPQDADGILGLGPTDLNYNTFFNIMNQPTNTTTPTISDTILGAFSNVEQKTVTLEFLPGSAPNYNETLGLISWGAIDKSADYTSANITTSSPASGFWGIDVILSYNGISLPVPSSLATEDDPSVSAILDSGTSLIALATDAYNAYVNATGAVTDTVTKLLSVTHAQFQQMGDLTVTVSGVNFTINRDAQVIPRDTNPSLKGGSYDKLYLVITDLKSDKWGCTLGLPFFIRYKIQFDYANNLVRLATTPYTNATINTISLLQVPN